MTEFGAIPISGNNGVPVWRQGQGKCLIYNLDLNNTVYISDDISVQPGSTHSAPLPPNSSIVVDGKYDLFAQCSAGQTATLGRFPGGRNFFNLAKLIVRTLIIEASAGNGLFVYDGNGNLTLGIVATDTRDPQTNVLCHAGLTTFNGHGFAISHLSTPLAAFFQYQDLGATGQGTMFMSISWHGGVDPYSGLTYVPGFFGYDPVFGDSLIGSGSQIQLSQLFITRRAVVIVNGNGSVTNIAPWMQIDAPEQTTAQHSQVQLLGATPDGVTRPNGSAAIANISGNGSIVPQTQAMWEIQGTAGGTLALNSPGGAPPSVAGNIQLWENNGMLGLVNGQGNGGTVPFKTISVGVNTITAAVFTNLAFQTVFAGDANHVGATYETEAKGFGTWGSTQQQLTFGVRFGGTAASIIGATAIIPATQLPASSAFFWTAKAKLTCTANPGTPTATWRAKIEVTVVASGGTAGAVVMGGTTTDVTLDGSINENFGISAEWASTTGAPTISKDISIFAKES